MRWVVVEGSPCPSDSRSLRWSSSLFGRWLGGKGPLGLDVDEPVVNAELARFDAVRAKAKAVFAAIVGFAY